MRYLSAFVLLVGVLVTGCDHLSKESGKSTSPAPPPAPTQSDQVVGVLLRCNLLVPAGTGGGATRTTDGSGDECDSSAFVITNRRRVLTIRTPQGTSYEAQVSPDVNVRVGDSWPVR